ncbi:alpha-amylase family glycosyl hydrolase [Desulfurococcus mucosus]|uniref:Alpha amylase catalytic region n=2 Tax=Desulfurococcus mucosus TaxID=2275 RepID=E8R8Y5_DESM0|nr:alpha-amylase family glycosyl hydrolase [Desulfurococcus mucosus]AAG31033.1 pullulanase [Desulfurococcus mucosus]ADV64961.1 alpha amylase catalytic region [Desulfurococcus mucosus DSM 2162]
MGWRPVAVYATLILVLLQLTPLPIAGASIMEIYVADDQVTVVHNPLDPAYLSAADGYLIPRIRVASSLDVASGTLVADKGEYQLKPQLATNTWRVYYATIPIGEASRGLNYYFKLTLRNNTVVYVYNATASRLFNFNGSIVFRQVEWVKSRVGYQIFPDRFYNGDPSNDLKANLTDELWINEVSRGVPVFTRWDGPVTSLHCCHQYFGGDLKGVTEKLDYLKELGVGLIYLNPIFLSGSVHGYDTYDYYTVDPKFGTLEDLKTLINEAHKRGIKVIFDFVPDHVGLGFWAFQDVYRNGRNSTYWSWFIVYKWRFKLGDPTAYKCWWGIGSLPQLNVLNTEVRQYLINVALYWLSIGFDGLRIDTPLDVIDSESFFRELREAVKSRYPDAYIVGEIWDYRPEWLRGNAFDSLMNYYLGRNILLSYARGALNGYTASMKLAEYYAGIGVNVAGMGFNIIGSHDTSRVLTDLGGGGLNSTPSNESIARLKLLSTLQYTQPGMPVVFQGDERGITGRQGNHDEQRYPIQWDRLNVEVYEHYKRLGELKNTIPALSTSIIHVLGGSGGLLAYTRGYMDEVLVIANNDASTPQSYELPPGNWTLIYASNNWSEVSVEHNTVTVPPLTALILVRNTVSETTTTSTAVTSFPGTMYTETTAIPGRLEQDTRVLIIVVAVPLLLATLVLLRRHRA